MDYYEALMTRNLFQLLQSQHSQLVECDKVTSAFFPLSKKWIFTFCGGRK